MFLRSHLANKCPNRLWACKYGCGVTREFRKLAEHELHSCPKRPTICPVGTSTLACTVACPRLTTTTPRRLRCQGSTG